ncbi:MAG: hypothetical protein WCH21_08880 [Bacteroidota bacterium]
MITKIKTASLINGNQNFSNVAISQRTVEDMATIVGIVAIVAAVLSLPLAIFILTYGLGN